MLRVYRSLKVKRHLLLNFMLNSIKIDNIVRKIIKFTENELGRLRFRYFRLNSSTLIFIAPIRRINPPDMT